jgi:hypothetical protein
MLETQFKQLSLEDLQPFGSAAKPPQNAIYNFLRNRIAVHAACALSGSKTSNGAET